MDNHTTKYLIRRDYKSLSLFFYTAIDASISDVQVGVAKEGFVDSTDAVTINGSSAPQASKTVYIKAGSLSGSGTASAEGGSSSTEPNRVFITADMISQNPQKVDNGEVAYSVNDNHDLTVTFSALSQGILINSGNLVGGDDVRVYFDSITFDPEQTDTAKTYIGLYDGTDYTNTNGMTPRIESDNIGIQINSSSRFETHGGVLPCTITFTNFRYEKL